ncbi:FdhF/YdeP family oxidoreductase [Acuticoccus sp.]|uniref:FdhF/YdeP family oxidoreductase n=1 Tax=Acuticoccus sp. TaxID=1904378 RepID=UPI003B51F2EA
MSVEPADRTHRTTRPDEGTPRYRWAAGGWGSLAGIARIFGRELNSPRVLRTLERQNKPGGHMCTSCAWAKPAKPHPFEFCENGAKATLWDLTPRRCGPEVFDQNTVSELRALPDYELERFGRLTHPMRYDAASDRYAPVDWDEAFAGIGKELKALDPKSAVFYASGRAALETSYLWALFARLYGHNNLPDSSNMCHETTSVALKEVIGSSVGTCTLDDFEHCDAIFFFGQNTGSNSPRFLHPLQAAVKRGCKVVSFNPVREKGLIEFVSPQDPLQMTVGSSTKIASAYLQVKPGGDIAAIVGLAKLVVEAEDAAPGTGLDHAFIEGHTTGFAEWLDFVRETSWSDIEAASGLTRAELAPVADIYVAAKATVGIYGMGLTQHVHGSQNIQALVNLLLMRGNVGRRGCGISPVRGHSNVQGQRTVGIAEKTHLVPLDRIAEQFGFDPPREDGMNTVAACEGILDGRVKAFVALGGNFLRAVPEQRRMEEAWGRMRLTVQIATKLNRSHLVNGEVAYLLPCLVRSEEDMQASGAQAVSMEDSLSHIHGSLGKAAPASPHLRSEPAIIAGIAKATLPDNPKVRWDALVGDYAMVRDLIAETYPDEFHDYNARMFQPGGFYRGNAARRREWRTEGGRARFTVPTTLTATALGDREGRMRLITMRSNDQFNTTIYGFSDRLRGVSGSRDVLFINRDEMARLGLDQGQRVTLASDAEDGEERRVAGLAVTAFDLPDGCVGAYYPETNPLVPLWYHDELSKTPAYKGVPVRIEA